MIVVGVSIFSIARLIQIKSYKEHQDCKITFDTNGGTKIDDLVFKCGTKVSAPKKMPVKDGFKFLGWTYMNQLFAFDGIINENIILVAKYVPLDGTKVVIVSFDSDGGTDVSPIEVMLGRTLTKPIDPIKYGYEFVGWYLDDKIFDFKQEINANITLKAKWKKSDKKQGIPNNIAVTPSMYKCSGTYESNVPTKELYTGNSINIHAIFTTGVTYLTDYCNITYKTSDSSIATITQDGTIFTVKKGNVYVYKCINDNQSGTEIGCFKGKIVIKEDNSINSEGEPVSQTDDTNENDNLIIQNPISVELSTKYVEIDIGQTVEVSHNYAPLEGEEYTFFCSPDNNNIQIKRDINNNKILITGISQGTSIVHCDYRSGNLYHTINDTIKVVVKYHKVEGISFKYVGDYYEATLGYGNICPEYVIVPENASNKHVRLVSSDPTIVSINGSCIRGLQDGTATISVITEDGNFSDSFVAKFNYVKPSSIQVFNCPMNAHVGDSFQISYRMTPQQITDSSVSWINLRERVATVDQNGFVTLIGTGQAIIRVQSNADENVRTTCSVNVLEN